jgi:hypothetical protein
MRIFTLAGAAIFLFTSAASACINDTETSTAESTFRSAYYKVVEGVTPLGQTFPWGIAALAAGLGLIVAGGFAVIHHSRK